MPKRICNRNSDEPTNKKIDLDISGWDRIELAPGEVLKDLSGKQWVLGENIGFGGFGVIHEVEERHFGRKGIRKDKYVVKIETHTNGPLFTEINCYLRLGKKEKIDEWTNRKKLSILGMPHYVASGSHIYKGVKYRFLVIPRYKRDLEAIFEEKKKFNLKTVLLISSHILQVLEYIHENGYIHSDIKAANIMLNPVKTFKNNSDMLSDLSAYSKSPVVVPKRRIRKCRNSKVRKLTDRYKPVFGTKRYETRSMKCIDYNVDNFFGDFSFFDSDEDNYYEKIDSEFKEPQEIKEECTEDQLYLLDFGLASKYKLANGQHKNCEDERKAHAGTLLFCSRDAHKGMQSRRSDLESLAYNMVYWLTGSLPWIDDLEDPEMTQRKKRHCFIDTYGFLHFCMADPPRILKDLFQYIKGLDVEERPDYNACQQIIDKALKEHGYYDRQFDFDNLEGWRLGKLKIINKVNLALDDFKRPPLLSNMAVKPILRKKTKKRKTQAALKWSMMLSNPEVLLKKVRDKKFETNDVQTVLDFDLEEMNPTYAMRDVYRKYEERKGLSPNSYGESDIVDLPEGYTPAMAAVRQKMLESKEMEEAMKPKKKAKKAKVNNRIKKTKQKPVLPTRTYCLRG